MRHLSRTTALGAAILIGAVAQGSAQEHSGPKAPRISFETLDSNADGQVTQAELMAAQMTRFTAMDRNGDQQVDEAELRASLEARAKARIDQRVSRMMERGDTNGDGAIDLSEGPQARSAKMLERADKDGNGAVSRAEFDASQEARKARRDKG